MKKLIQFISNSIHFVENNIQNKVISTLQLVKKLPTSKNYLLQKIAYCKLPTAKLPTAKLPTAHCLLPTANRLLKKTTYCLLLIAYCQLATAQVYPIQVTPQLIPPYSLKLSDYQTTSSEKLFVNLLLTDTQELGYQVRLKMYIEGQGLNIRTLDFVAGAPPLFLDGGFNLRLSNLDLQAYFNLNNLIGITSRQYSRPLPDGRYDFCFEVYDFFTGQRLSRKSCFPVYLILNDPPILNVPGRGDLVTAQIPQNIIFNWTPRHLNATSVQYEFTLKELWDTGLDPQAAFLSSPPLFQTTTFPTTLLYGPADIQLIEGKTYGWQVRALVSDGISETSVFRNNGYSEIFHFKYEGNCDVPNFIQSEVQNTQTVQIRWSFSDHLRYEIQYRKKGYGDEDWFSVFAYKPQSKIHNLEAGITYEYRVGGECTFQGGFAFSPIYEFTTLTEEEVAYDNCGQPPPKIDLSNKDPLPNIGVNEVFRAADFPVTVLEVQSKGDGVYSGWGFTRIPFLGDTKIRVEFKDIRINTDFQMIRGRVKTTYTPTWKGIEDVEDAIDAIVGDNGEIETFDATTIDIDDVVVDKNGQIILIDEAEKEIPIEVAKNVIITDKNNDQWQVDKDGNATPLGKAAVGGTPNVDNTNGIANSGNITQISSSDVFVLFTPSGFYSTDELRQDIIDKRFTEKYETIPQASGGNYNVLYKAISNAPQPTDQLIATATLNNGKTTDDIVFKTKQGTAVPTTWSGNTATLTLKKQFNFAKDEILATVKPTDSTANYTIAGKVNIWHLAQQQVNITLVPVGNGTTNDSIANKLNVIYNPVGIQINVTVDDQISIPQSIWDIENTNGQLDIGNSNILANYTPEERAIYNYYKTQRTLQDQMYYIFVLGDDISTTDTNAAGFMPLKRQYGFVFNPPNKSRTIAHELGHGIFGLEHPFTEYAIREGTTDLLMDYGTGTAFTHLDWQKIHAPGLEFYVFQGDEDGESESTTDPLEKLISAIIASGNKGLIKCKKCEAETYEDTIDNIVHTSFNGESYICIIAEVLNNNVIEFDTSEIYENAITTSEGSNLFNFIKEETDNDEDVLFLVNDDNTITKCNVIYPLPDDFCYNQTLPNEVETQLAEETEGCLNTILDEIKVILITLKENSRSNQQNEFYTNGNIYKLNANNELEASQNPLTDIQIENGEWTDTSIDQIFRVHRNSNGILQFKSVGIRNTLEIFTYREVKRTANLKDLSKNMKEKGNQFLDESNVSDVDDTPLSKNINLNHPDVGSVGLSENDYADGEQINIDESVSFFKIIYEGAGLLGTLLKTGDIEEPTYLERTKGQVTIHGPPIVTGSTEAGVRSVTDITGIVVLIYDLAVSQEKRDQTKNDLKSIKNQIFEDPSTLWPMLGESLLEEGSGNSVADWEDATNENVDFGKRKHLYSRGAVRTTVSVVLGGQFIAKLPQIAKNLISKIKRSKGRIKIKDVAKKVTEASQKRLNELLEKIKNLPNKGIDFLNDFAEATKETIEAFLKRPSLVDAWKVIVNNPILRKKPENLESISKWLDEGIEPQKLTDGIGKSPSKQNLIDKLGTAQSKLHTQVLIKNYDNIPGVKKGRYTPNGSVLSDKADLPNGWANNMDLPSKEIKNFTGKIEHLELNHGDIIYRVSSANRVKGPYWTRTKPNKLDDVVGGTAVVPEWNNFQYLSEYTIPNGITVKCWKGKAASQPVGFKPDGTPLPSNYHLPGGDEQLFIKFIGHQDPNFEGIVKSIKIEW